MENKYDLFGLAVGYDYNYPLIDKLSVFAGAEIGMTKLESKKKYYTFHYDNINNDKISKFQYVVFDNNRHTLNSYYITPLLGMRYQFQRLLMEAQVGYSFYRTQLFIDDNTNILYRIDGEVENKPNKGAFEPHNTQLFSYQLNILYAF
ncbi:MAG: hypothetical protein Q4G63_12845 [Bacteroidia bacterium]|nr:hypothetical protein [Bacteroidia bacterium]